MLLEAVHLSKSIGPKDLFSDLSFSVDHTEKIALIGRNGQGKTTILKMMAGEDGDYGGKIKTKKGLRATLTKQEHMKDTHYSALQYILQSVPDYLKCEKILADFENGEMTDIRIYSKALDRFTERGYFYIKDKILTTLTEFDLDAQKAHLPLTALSGGEKRYVELCRLMYSDADLYLIDEPTNHMDYAGKAQFISWLQALKKAVVVVTHDRDVLHVVDKIIELKEKKIHLFRGNFDQYRKQNTIQTLSSVKLYQDQLNRLKEAKKRMEWGRRMRAKSKEWKVRYDHWLRDYEKIKAETVKPSFWIDQESTDTLDAKVTDSYERFKEKNIAITMKEQKERINTLLTVTDVALGYDAPVFSGLTFDMRSGERVFIKGRNGAGKSTLVQTLLAFYREMNPPAKVFAGDIKLGNKVRLGEYEQELNARYLPLTLEDAILNVYSDAGTPITDQELRSTLARYLFDPMVDGKLKIKHLSGGQKARFQIIKMLANKPHLLILDEPTNHLDLPSIEELEKALDTFDGGILYISHDSYFIDNLGGVVIEL
jgi:ATP-binding cassette, subfamily F, member 3